MEKITTTAASTLVEITVMRLQGLTTVNMQTLAVAACNSFAVLKTAEIEFLEFDDQTIAVVDLFNQVWEKLEDAMLEAVSMNTHFVKSAQICDDGFRTKTVKVTLHRD